MHCAAMYFDASRYEFSGETSFFLQVIFEAKKKGSFSTSFFCDALFGMIVDKDTQEAKDILFMVFASAATLQ